MNRLTEALLERIEGWSDEARDQLVQSIVEIEQRHVGTYRLSDDERIAVRNGLKEMRDGNLASEEQIAGLFARFRS